jgi:hypothetical protein
MIEPLTVTEICVLLDLIESVREAKMLDDFVFGSWRGYLATAEDKLRRSKKAALDALE